MYCTVIWRWAGCSVCSRVGVYWSFVYPGVGLFLVTLSYSVPKCSATAGLVLSGLIPIKHWAVYITRRLVCVVFPPLFLVSIPALLLFRGRSCSVGCFKVCVREEEVKGEGERGRKGRARVMLFLAGWPIIALSFRGPAGDAHAEGRGDTCCWSHLCAGGPHALWHLAPLIASLIN